MSAGKNAMPVQFGIERLSGGDRLVKTVGLARMGQREICAKVAKHSNHDFDHQVMGVIGFLVNYIVNTGARIKPDESLEYGWTLFRFLERSPGLLEAHELADPLSDEAEPPVTPGIDRAIGLTEASRDVMKRNRLTGASDFPYRGMLGESCTHLAKSPFRQLYIERSEPHEERDSGWTFTCGNSGEDHGFENLRKEHLAHIGRRRPFVVPYLGMPIGSAAEFDNRGAIVFPTGKDAGRRDPADPYAVVPGRRSLD